MTDAETRDEAYCPMCDRSFGVAGANCPHDGTKLVKLGRDPMLGRSIDGRFVTRDRIGEGGMGVVYRAWQESVQRDVALKVMRFRPGVDNVIAKRFLREARLASQLAHPSTVAVIDFGQTDDQVLYLVMELVRGTTLAQVLAAGEPLGPRRAVRIAIQLADALENAHRHGIIHRDLKPGNVMVLDEPAGKDAIKVLDFGLAKALHASEPITHISSSGLLGTPTYMAPEMATGAPIDERIDLYAVGVMLYEMLAGQPPFVSNSVHHIIALHATAMPPALPPEVSPALAAVVGRLLAKDPAQRIQTATELRAELDAIADGLGPDAPGLAHGTGRLGTGRPGSQPGVAADGSGRSRKATRIAAAGATVALVGAVAAGAVSRPAAADLTRAREPAVSAPNPNPTAATEPTPTPTPVIELTIDSTPSGAILEVDGIARGLTPLTIEVPRGAMIALRVSLKGYRARTLQVRADDATPIEVALTRQPVRPFAKP